MKTIWTEAAIRAEMTKQDKKTGLKGGRTPYKF